MRRFTLLALLLLIAGCSSPVNTTRSKSPIPLPRITSQAKDNKSTAATANIIHSANGNIAYAFYFSGSPPRHQRRVVYLIDTSYELLGDSSGESGSGSGGGPGSEFATDVGFDEAAGFDCMFKEVQRSIGQLSSAIDFTVILVHGRKTIESPEPGLKSAVDSAKRKAIAWLDRTHGRFKGQRQHHVSASKAVELALSYRPQYLYILTFDGRKLLTPAIAQRLRKFAGGTCHIIQFLNPTGHKHIQQIAERTGGIAKMVTRKDLQPIK